MFFQYETPRLLLKVLRADCAPQVLDFYNRDKELFEMYEIDRVPDFYTVKHLQKVLRYEYNMAVKSQLFRFYVFQKENPCRIIGTVCIRSDIMYTHSANNPARIYILKNIKSEKQ